MCRYNEGLNEESLRIPVVPVLSPEACHSTGFRSAELALTTSSRPNDSLAQATTRRPRFRREHTIAASAMNIPAGSSTALGST
jgi:hypothetical protein